MRSRARARPSSILISGPRLGPIARPTLNVWADSLILTNQCKIAKLPQNLQTPILQIALI